MTKLRITAQSLFSFQCLKYFILIETFDEKTKKKYWEKDRDVTQEWNILLICLESKVKSLLCIGSHSLRFLEKIQVTRLFLAEICSSHKNRINLFSVSSFAHFSSRFQDPGTCQRQEQEEEMFCLPKTKNSELFIEKMLSMSFINLTFLQKNR